MPFGRYPLTTVTPFIKQNQWEQNPYTTTQTILSRTERLFTDWIYAHTVLNHNHNNIPTKRFEY